MDGIAKLYLPDNNCPVYDPSRYAALRGTSTFIALDLFNAEAVLPQILESIILACSHIGLQHCFVSIYESRSNDKTVDILEIAKEYFSKVGLRCSIVSTQNDTDPTANHSRDRIKHLASFRNRALEPLKSEKADVVLFINDIFLCPYQIFELIHQHTRNAADLTCGFDWHDWELNGTYPIFYDNWVSRLVNGEMFVDISFPELLPWEDYSSFLTKHEPSREKYLRGEPFQVYSCWNGLAVLNPAGFKDYGIEFRSANLTSAEPNQSECSLLVKDFWSSDLFRIMVVPNVNHGYRREVAQYWNTQPRADTYADKRVEFIRKPPIEVHCQSLPVLGGDPWLKESLGWDLPIAPVRYKESGSPYGVLQSNEMTSIADLYDDRDLAEHTLHKEHLLQKKKIADSKKNVET